MQPGHEQLTDWMERRGFTNSEAADYLKLPAPEVSMFANDRRNPGLLKALQIERLTGIPVEAWALNRVHEVAAIAPDQTVKPQISKE